MSTTMKAFVMTGEKGQAHVASDRARPALRPSYVRVAVSAVALNPTDWKHIAWANKAGLLSGCDFAGTVEETGSDYAKGWKKGDRICGMVHGGNSLQSEDGAFAEHIVAKADVQMRIPASMSNEEAATLGVGVMTVGQGLFQAMGLDMPDPKGGSKAKTGAEKWLLVYGGSSATGALGIQFAKLAGYTVVTTCSKRNFDYVKGLGAEEAFDYNDEDCAAKIKEYTSGQLKYAWDCIALPASAKICAEALAAGDGIKYGCILAVEFPREDVQVTPTLAYSALGEPFDKGFAKSENGEEADFVFAKAWIAVAEELLAQGKVRVHKPRVGQGLERIQEGLDAMKADKVSGEKLVYKI